MTNTNTDNDNDTPDFFTLDARTKKMHRKELEEKLKTWREQRGIDKHSTAEAQINGFYEERLEAMDAIGDMYVFLINAQALGADKGIIDAKIIDIEAAALCINATLEECADMAFREIEHRIGLVRKTGKFTKWKDLTHEERLIVAASGQLFDAPRDVREQAMRACTPAEWSEVLDASRGRGVIHETI